MRNGMHTTSYSPLIYTSDVVLNGAAETVGNDVAALRLFGGELQRLGRELWKSFGD